MLSHLKKLVSVESASEEGSEVELSIARETLAECVERLEQRANTALIQCYVRTFTDVRKPLHTLFCTAFCKFV